MPSWTNVPSDFAMPAGFIAIASPSSDEATDAPAREAEMAPAPGSSRPPAAAVPEMHNPIVRIDPLRFIRPRTYLTALALEKPYMGQEDRDRGRGHAADARGL